jgi:glycine cleavage system H protein
MPKNKVKTPENVLCTKSHEYLLEEDGVAKIGITDYAAHQLGEVVFVELPEVGQELSKGDIFGTIESVKAASDLYMPVSGKIEEVNEDLSDEPERVNEDPYSAGWMIKISEYDKTELGNMMSVEKYLEFVED